MSDDAGALGQVEALRLLANHALGLLTRPHHQITIEHIELEGPHEAEGKERRQHLWIVRLDCTNREEEVDKADNDAIVVELLPAHRLAHCNLSLPILHCDFDLICAHLPSLARKCTGHLFLDGRGDAHYLLTLL